MKLLGSPLIERLSPNQRAVLMMCLLAVPFVRSAILGFILTVNHQSNQIHVDVRLLILQAVYWLVVLSSAYYCWGMETYLGALKQFRFLDLIIGFAWSIVLRIASIILICPFAFIVATFLSKYMVHQPVSLDMFAKQPVLMLIEFSILSASAGFFEESWRFGMLCGLRQLMPHLFKSPSGAFAAILLVAMMFGLGHTYEGPLGVLVTGLLGLLLGCVMVYRRSFWEAAIAHGFIDGLIGLALFIIAVYCPWLPDWLEAAAKKH